MADRRGLRTEILITRSEAVPHARAGTSTPPIPHRKVIRSWLAPIATPNTALALSLVVLDFLLYGAAMALAVASSSALLQVVGGLLAGVVISRLFILGHDSCHQSFTRHRTLNRWVGRLSFMPSLTPYSLWAIGHNVVHHGYTNLSGFDFVWQPLTLAEYRALSRARQWLERVYRSGWAPWLYYLVEIWWKRMVFPSREFSPVRRRVFRWDCLLVSAYAVAWIAALVVAAATMHRSIAWTLVTGFVLPFLLWNGMIGFVVYVHHTHRDIAWYADKAAWSAASPFVSTTVHLTFRSAMSRVLHHILEHTAHHVDMSVPLYRLRKAQTLLEKKLAAHIVVQPFSWRWYVETARGCKLYDFTAGAWTDFSGRRTDAAVR